MADGSARFSANSLAITGAPITLCGSQVYTTEMMNVSRALGPAQLSRAYFWFTRDGILYVVDYTHQGQGADPRSWNPSLVGATRIQVSLASGTRSATEVAMATAAALTAALIPVVRDGARLRIFGATGLTVAPSMTVDESRRGMWGAQRVDFGGPPSTAPSFPAVNGTVGVHVTSQATAGRILGVYYISSSGARTGNMRLGVANGPAYSTTPGAMSGGVDGVATRNGNLYVVWFSEPVDCAASVSKWLFYKTNTASSTNVAVRPHGSTPVGNGDLTVGQQIVIDATVTDPAISIFSGGTYTPTTSSNAAVYAAIGYIYELPTGGLYVGSGGFETRVGFHGAFNAGTPSTTGPTVLDGLADTPRQPLPWSGCRIRGARQACAAISATEDFGYIFYDFSATNPAVYPLNAAAPLLGFVGAINAPIGAGYKEFACDFDATGVTQIGMLSNGGNRDGSIPATTITISFTAPGAAGAWLDGWVDDGRTWDDMVPERGGYGNNAQYLTLPGAMPFGNPGFIPANNTNRPPLFLTAPPAGGTPDGTASNHPRIAWTMFLQGMIAA